MKKAVLMIRKKCFISNQINEVNRWGISKTTKSLNSKENSKQKVSRQMQMTKSKTNEMNGQQLSYS